MLLVLSKFLALPLYPVGFSLVCIVAGIVFLLFSKKTYALLFVVCALIVLYLFSSDPFSYILVRSLEKKYDPVIVFPSSSAIVLLSGAEVPKSPPRLYDEINSAGDRILYAGRLMKQGAAPRLIATGGNIPFIREFNGSESEVCFRILTGLLGVDSSKIYLEKQARNTRENATFTKAMLDSLGLPPAVILVTSAMHMPRSVALFRKAGFTVYPAPTDYLVDAEWDFKMIKIFPAAGTLERSTNALHEIYGVWYSWLMGWL
ncbi:MAG: YdcF family protein [Chitinispirillaceae bacterium]|jgi:uncharacterized SAM-binding protein YcdF (DUF218 family)|nr:YdcF family protein [Chitinispirillaceae bacterium]